MGSIGRAGMAGQWAIGLLLWGGIAFAGNDPEADPASASAEAELLTRYLFLTCAAASYERLDPPAPGVVALLQAEAWVYVERGRVGAAAYARLHPLAAAKGREIPPAAAIRGCLDWSEGDAAGRSVAEIVGQWKRGE